MRDGELWWLLSLWWHLSLGQLFSSLPIDWLCESPNNKPVPCTSPHPFLSKLVWVGFQLFATKESQLTLLPYHSEKKWGLGREGVGGNYERTKKSPEVLGKWPRTGRYHWSQKLTSSFFLPKAPDRDPKAQKGEKNHQGDPKPKCCPSLRSCEEELSDININNNKGVGASKGQNIKAILPAS